VVTKEMERREEDIIDYLQWIDLPTVLGIYTGFTDYDTRFEDDE